MILYYYLYNSLKHYTMLNVTEFNKLESKAMNNTTHFKFNDLFLKGCKNCNKLVKHKHTNNPRYMKENRFVYICECVECNTPMLLDGVDFYLLHNKV